MFALLRRLGSSSKRCLVPDWGVLRSHVLTATVRPILTALVLDVGGLAMGTFGAAIFVVAQDYVSTVTVNWMSFIGLIFVLAVLFFPKGLLGSLPRRARA